MLSHSRTSVSAALVALATVAGHASAQTTAPAALGLGDPAPAINVAEWVKGTPLTAFEPGHVYVVEFWATWCAPCKKAIPHLTELAKRHKGKVTVVGVSVWERPTEQTDAGVATLVEKFVTSMGEKMDYNVAFDGVAGRMAATWLEPAKQDGIPASFVVDRQGRIAWIGLPTGLDAVLDKVLAGTWDIDAEKRRVVAEDAASADRKSAENAILKAYQAKDDKGVLAAIDVAEQKFPGTVLHPDLISVKLQALFRVEPAAARAYVEAITGPDGVVTQKPDFVWSVLRVIPDAPDVAGLTAPDWAAIADGLAPAAAKAKPFSALYERQSVLLGRAGRVDAAIEAQKKAVGLSEAFLRDNPGQTSTADTEQLARQRKRLAEITAGR